MNTNTKITGVLFDLDGTLVDTALDLVHALNLSLQEHGFTPCDEAKVRPAASHGSLVMVQTALPDQTESVHFDVRLSMLSHYQQVNGDKGRLFKNLDKFLDSLASNDIPFGIVTNKPARFTRPLTNKLNLTDKLKCIVSGDSTKVQKPELAPMLLAAQQLECKPENILYLGDAQRDIDAANNSGMISVLVEWGYIGEKDNPESWNADLSIKDPLDLLSLFKN
ncbi:HAD family hydrolase [Shewanella sp. OPT22]|nr:HAD family hydrolase [Shewanella sp. OPT22]